MLEFLVALFLSSPVPQGDGTIIIHDGAQHGPAKINPTILLPCGMVPEGWPCY